MYKTASWGYPLTPAYLLPCRCLSCCTYICTYMAVAYPVHPSRTSIACICILLLLLSSSMAPYLLPCGR
ncbi:hypothetical protein F5Y15DRAFT_15537 [Xylariaceae sp. FL0016]|nr:hypothetical protein F5Y15DRAFT_15537 [Xylariaceae sp. FL0016]